MAITYCLLFPSNSHHLWNFQSLVFLFIFIRVFHFDFLLSLFTLDHFCWVLCHSRYSFTCYFFFFFIFASVDIASCFPLYISQLLFLEKKKLFSPIEILYGYAFSWSEKKIGKKKNNNNRRRSFTCAKKVHIRNEVFLSSLTSDYKVCFGVMTWTFLSFVFG